MSRGSHGGRTFHPASSLDPGPAAGPTDPTAHDAPGVDGPDGSDDGGWSSRDLLILELVSAHTPHAGIARRLSCSVSTVERRLGALRAELGVETTIEVVVRAVRAGVI